MNYTTYHMLNIVKTNVKLLKNIIHNLCHYYFLIILSFFSYIIQKLVNKLSLMLCTIYKIYK